MEKQGLLSYCRLRKCLSYILLVTCVLTIIELKEGWKGGLKAEREGERGFKESVVSAMWGGRAERFLTSDFQLLKIHVDKKAT